MTLKHNALEKYHTSLVAIPPPGGNGCHSAIMSAANYGAHAGVTAERMSLDIRKHIPKGGRHVPDREIRDAVDKALGERKTHPPCVQARQAPVVHNGKMALRKIIEQGTIRDDAGLWEASPVRLWDEPQKDRELFLSVLYKADDLIWIGDKYETGVAGKTIRTSAEWLQHLKRGGKTGPHFVPNPLSGCEGLTKSGKPSFRCDSVIRSHRFAMAEFDKLTREEQICFWSAVRLPVSALIDSGGKSVHALIDLAKLTRVETPEQWQSEIKERLYSRILTPLGVDANCSNSSRLSRLPGHYRHEKQAWQRLLWLSSEGRPVAC